MDEEEEIKKIEKLEKLISDIYCQKRFEQLYSQLMKSIGFNIPNSNKKIPIDFNPKDYSLSGDRDKEKVLIFLLLTIINQFYYERVIKYTEEYDFVFDFPLDIIFMVSISDLTPAILSLMSLKDKYDDEFSKKYPEIKDYISFKIDENNEAVFSITKKEKKNYDVSESEITINKEEKKLYHKNGKNYDVSEIITTYLEYNKLSWETEFKDLLKSLNYQDLMEIAYLSAPDEDNLLINDYFIKKFIDNDSFRSAGIHDMINLSNNILNDYHKLSPESNTTEGKFFENAFHKISGYFIDIVQKSYSPFLSSSIYETVYKLKKVLPKGEIQSKIKRTMNSILEKTNNIKMSSDQQKESLPYYFLDLSGAPLHKLMELNPKTINPFTLSPYLLKKDLPNIEVLVQTDNKKKKCQSEFDSKIFSCSPNAYSTIAVVRDIFVEYDPITERLMDHQRSMKNIFKEKQTSPLPGMLIFKLSMLQWDFMPNFTHDDNFVPVFQVPYNSINKYAINKIDRSNSNDIQLGKPEYYFLDLHTADCNLCFYPLTESEKNSIGKFFREQIRIEEYVPNNLKRHFMDKTKSEMVQTALNYIPNMIKEKNFPSHPPDEQSIPTHSSVREVQQNKKEKDENNPYSIMFKDFGSLNITDEWLEKLEIVVEKLCAENSTTLLLESVCYLCQKQPACASKVLDLLEKELRNANESKRKLMLTIIDRIIDPAILQNQQQLIYQAKKLTEYLQFVCNESENTIDPGELGKKVMNIAKGSHFFCLSSEDRKERLEFDNVHREWLMNSIPNNYEIKED